MKKRTLLMCSALCLLGAGLNAQSLSKMKMIPGGTSLLGGGYQYEIQGSAMHYLGKDPQFEQLNANSIAIGEVPAENNPALMVTVADFYLAETEVSNLEYRNFIIASVFSAEEQKNYEKAAKKALKGDSEAFYLLHEELETRAEKAGILPNVDAWTEDFVFAFNEPLTVHYFWHPAFDEYPVVAVSWDQAKAYCAWLTKETNEALSKKGKPALPEFRLPTEMEWEYAARGGKKSDDNRSLYPWGSHMIMGNTGFQANVKSAPQNYIGDGYEYTAPVKTFEPNAYGLYNIAGNVGEWTEDVFRVRNEASASSDNVWSAPADVNVRVAKGGSWADYCYAAKCGSRTGFDATRGNSRVGFRVAMTKAK